jgi:hypothetical protein
MDYAIHTVESTLAYTETKQNWILLLLSISRIEFSVYLYCPILPILFILRKEGDRVVWRAYTGVILYTVYLTRFRTYKITLPVPPGTKTLEERGPQTNNCRQIPVQVNFYDI